MTSMSHPQTEVIAKTLENIQINKIWHIAKGEQILSVSADFTKCSDLNEIWKAETIVTL